MKTAEIKTMVAEFKVKMNEDVLQSCMRCGFCLPSCPTYIISNGKESSSPRGRIALMKAVADGTIEPDADFERTINECLGCLACENVCPSGVRYMELLEDARNIIVQSKKHSLPVRAARNVVFNNLFANQKRMERFASLLRFYQKSGLRAIARGTRIIKLFPKGLSSTEKVLPNVASYKKIKNRPLAVKAKGEPLAKVGFFKGCLMDTMFLAENDKTLKLLQLAGCDIQIPNAQACCAAIHGHSGEKDTAKELAKQNIAAFENLEVDYIITNAGGCGAYLMEYGVLLKDDPEWSARATTFVAKIKDVSKILVELDFHNRFSLRLPKQVVTYQDSCHLKNVMKTEREPRTLIQSIDGVLYHEQENAGSCCGSAGTYSILQHELSMKILDAKMKKVLATEATTIVTANPGCLLQMKVGVEREGLSGTMKAVHIVELLFEATGLSETDPL